MYLFEWDRLQKRMTNSRIPAIPGTGGYTQVDTQVHMWLCVTRERNFPGM